MKYKVIMICKEIWRAETTVTTGKHTPLEEVKDMAWEDFDKLREKDLEQENYTKVIKLIS